MLIDKLRGGEILFWTQDFPVWLFMEGENPDHFFAWLLENTGCDRQDTPYRKHSWRLEMIGLWRNEKHKEEL